METYFEDSNPDPEAEEEVSASVAIEVDDEDEPNQVETEGADSNTDLDDVDDGPEQPDVERFSSMLQEAQHLATQYCHENAWKVLASKGFLDLVSFMALKKREREEIEAQNEHESASSEVQEVNWHGRDSAPSGTPGLPFTTISGENLSQSVCEVDWHGRGSVLSRTPGLAITTLSGGWGSSQENMVLVEEEEDSPGSEPELGAKSHKVNWRCGGSAPSGTPGLTIAALSRRFGCRDMVLAEEEEGSPESEPELAAHWPGYPREVGWCSQGFAPSETTGSSVTGGADNEDSSLEDEEKRTPSIGSSGHLSLVALGLEPGGDLGDLQSELASLQDADGSLYSGPEDLDGLGGGDDQGAEDAKCTINTPFDRALDLWKDQERLGKACTSLTAKSKDLRLDVFLWTRLTGMLGVLNFYLNPALRYTWREASLVIARIQGGGEKRVHKLCQWVLDFVRIGELPSPRYGQAHWMILEDEDIKQTIQLHLLECTKARHVTAGDIIEIVSTPELQEKFSQAGITKLTISECTACHWLSRLDWQYGQPRKGMYIDGHEHEDVVEYRKAFVKRWKEYEKRFHLWDDNSDLLPLLNGFPVPKAHGRFCLILVTHDESTFFQNDLQKTRWAHKGDKPTPQPKGNGQSLMVSDFLTADWGRLCDGKESV
ncbi:hypothetical protein EDB92DRAFT_1954391 [Lactarius akahatsu]|uniref:Uncharacterized protein n=1 Tax=Lactarius akahatsu TaxID=416441 RepID=A0AAD4L7F2_9AGAM|nr:hypothetical protein EDB92DRAFT_1954391 [Lactarius akahatsu]